MKTTIARFLRDEEGATAIEYGLIAGLIAVALAVVLGNVGTRLEGVFQTIFEALPVTPSGEG